MKERQVSFAGGELSPHLWGRTDLDRYPVGARSLLNFIVEPQGVLSNRPGTRHVDLVKDRFFDGISRLVPFIYSDTDACLLVFTALRMYVYVYDSDTGLTSATFELSTPYTATQLAALRFAQVGNILTIATVDHPPYELRRTTNTDWILRILDFDIPEPPSWAGTAKLEKRYMLYTPGSADEDPDHDFDGDSSHRAKEWSWAITRIMRDSSGRLYETSKQVVTREYDAFGLDGLLPEKVAVYPDWTQAVVWGAFQRSSLIGLVSADDISVDFDPLNNNSTPPSDADALIKTRVYRGRDGVYGFLGESDSNYFVDDGSDPDFANPPPSGTNPFKVYDAEGTLLRTEDPAIVTFFENRRYFAATEERPNFIWGSAVDDYANFDEILPADEADSLSFGLVANTSQAVVALVPQQKLLALTGSSIWALGGAGDNELLTPVSIAARSIKKIGAASLSPVEAADTLFFIKAKGAVPTAIDFADGAKHVPVAIMSRHLFDGHTIVDWAYAEDPHSILWVVRDDGVLLSLTYVAEHNVIAWARHEIAGDGLVESIAVIPQEEEDAVYLVVNRDDVRTIEQLASRIFTDIRDAIFLDSSVTYDGRNTDEDNTVTVSDSGAVGTGTLGEEFTVTFVTDPDLGVDDMIQIVDPDQDEPLRFQVISVTGAGVYVVQLMNIAFEDDLFGVAVDDWAICANSITGVEHLEGETVSAVVDGAVHTGLVVTGGSVDLGDYFAVAHAGRTYNADFESLDAINEKGREKIISKVALELEHTRGGTVGSSLDGKLSEVRTREVSDAYLAADAKRVDVDLIIQDTWNRGGRIAFRQDQPMPVTILGLTRDIKHGGD